MEFKKGEIYRNPTATRNGYFWFKVVKGPQEDENGERYITTSTWDPDEKHWINENTTLYMRPECLADCVKVKNVPQ
jgi:hypothetical protein